MREPAYERYDSFVLILTAAFFPLPFSVIVTLDLPAVIPPVILISARYPPLEFLLIPVSLGPHLAGSEDLIVSD